MQIPGMSIDPTSKGFVITPWLGNMIFDVICVIGLLFAATLKINPLRERKTKIWLKPIETSTVEQTKLSSKEKPSSEEKPSV